MTYGGVGIFIKETLLNSYTAEILDNSYEGILCLLLKDKISEFSFTVYCCYLPPEYSPYGRDSTSFFTHLLSLIYLNNYVDCSFVLGDFNGRLGEKSDIISAVDNIPARDVIDFTQNKHGEALLDFLIEARMVVTAGRVAGQNDFTSISSKGTSVVDYIAVPHENIGDCSLFNVKTVSDIISENRLESMVSSTCKAPDHSLLTLKYNVGFPNSTSCTDPNDQTHVDINKRYNYGTMSEQFLRSETWINILDSLIEKVESGNKSQSHVDTLYDEMLSEIFTEMDAHINYREASKSTRKHYKNHKPFWNNELTKAWKLMASSEKEYIQNKHRGLISRNLYQDFIYKRKLFDRLLRNTERNYYRQKALEIEHINTSNPVEFWKCINSLGPKRKTSIPMQVYTRDALGETDKTSDPEIVLNTWKRDFYNLYNMSTDVNSEIDDEFHSRVSASLPDIKEFELNNHDAVEFSYNSLFTLDELQRVCNSLKLGKSVGIDNIPNEVLRHDGIRRLLLGLFNVCFVNNVIPSIWRKSVIAPIPKSSTKDPCVPLNYRGISLLSCMYKLYTSLINRRLTSYCDENEYLVDEQNGFRSERSCQDHIYVLSSLIKNRKSVGNDTFCAFVDFKKAFDWIPWDLLLYKLSNSFNIHGHLFNTLSTIYSSSSAQVRLNGKLTDPFEVTSGVKQGDIISPILFSMYLNDLATGIKQLNCGIDIDGLNLAILLYADDIVLMAPDEESLQKMISFVNTWCKKWKMAVNTDKTQVVHFRRQSALRTSFEFHMGNANLEIVPNYKYLGVTFDEHLTFENNASILSNAAVRSLGQIRNKLKNLKECGYNSFNTLFTAGVLSIADYGAGVWGTKCFNKIEQVQYRAARYFLGVHRFAPIHALLGDMGWCTAKTRHKILSLKFWNRLCNLNENRITRKIFEWDLTYSTKRGTWCHAMKNLLYELGCSDNFDSSTPCDIEFASSVLYDRDNIEWDEGRYSSDKLRYYNLYKYDKDVESYLKLNISRYQRSILAQFRCGILPLQIEVGRYRDINLSERLCQMCNQNVVEDEIHFLCDCACYSELRNDMFRTATSIDQTFLEKDNIDKFVTLMSNNQKSVINFLTRAIAKRTNLLNICNI